MGKHSKKDFDKLRTNSILKIKLIRQSQTKKTLSVLRNVYLNKQNKYSYLLKFPEFQLPYPHKQQLRPVNFITEPYLA